MYVTAGALKEVLNEYRISLSSTGAHNVEPWNPDNQKDQREKNRHERMLARRLVSKRLATIVDSMAKLMEPVDDDLIISSDGVQTDEMTAILTKARSRGIQV